MHASSFSVLVKPGSSRKQTSNESTPPIQINFHIPSCTCQGGVVAAIFHTSLSINLKLQNSLESHSSSLSHLSWEKNQKVILLYIAGMLFTHFLRVLRLFNQILFRYEFLNI